MTEKRGNWLWDRLRKQKRKHLDRLQESLVKGLPPEKRDYAGDPNQPPHFRIPLRRD